MSGSRTCSRGWARGRLVLRADVRPLEMEAWQGAVDAASPGKRRAGWRSRGAARRTMTVTRVGHNAAMPCRWHSETTSPTSSTVRVAEANALPWQPLIWRSNRAGATQPAERSTGLGLRG